MRIVCPDCDTAYEVPDAALRPGRMVRCARCHQSWMPTPPMLEAVPEPVPDPPTRADRMPELQVPDSWPAYEPLVSPHPEVRETERGRAAVLVAWLLSVAVLGAAAGAAYIGRTEVMRLWPPSQRVYDLVGWRSPGSG